MPKQKKFFTIPREDRGILHDNLLKIVGSFTDDNGVEWHVGNDHTVYRSFPLYLGLSGQHHLILLKQDQLPWGNMGGWARRSAPPRWTPCPEYFELRRVGVKEHKREPEGYIGTHHIVSVFEDKRGNWWSGSTHWPLSVGWYEEDGQVKFVAPALDLLGQDTTNLWVDSPHRGEKTRLTIATYEVCEAIEKVGAFGIYFPAGKAISDPEIATVEAIKVLGNTFQGAKDQLEKAKDALANLATEKAELESKLVEAQGKLEDYRVRSVVPKKDLDDALSKLREAEQALEEEKHRADKLQALVDKARAARREKDFNPMW